VCVMSVCLLFVVVVVVVMYVWRRERERERGGKYVYEREVYDSVKISLSEVLTWRRERERDEKSFGFTCTRCGRVSGSGRRCRW
jgi:hypothetical protein